MKKIIALIGIHIVLLTACATVVQDSAGQKSGDQVVPLDEALRAAAEHIQNMLEAGAKVALLNFSSPSDAFSAYVLDELSDLLVNGGKVVVVNRTELDLIRQEERFQLSGEVSDATAVSIGQKIGAQVIVSGSLTDIGRIYRVRIRALEVETAVIAASRYGDIDSREERVRTLLAGRTPVAETSTQVAAQLPSTPVAPQQTQAAQPTTIPGFVRVEGGTFTMGSPSSEAGRDSDEGPQRQVTVSSFYMGRHEVTQREWTAVMGNNPSYFKGDNLPVENVSWFDAIEYANRLSQREGLTPAYTISGSGDTRTVMWNRNANGYRLPTEAEWEYAARAGTTTRFNVGNDITTSQANFANSLGRTTAVGSFAANAWGLHDMHGNVWEWVWDWYGTYPSVAETNPTGASSGTIRVRRGGGWGDPAQNLRSAYRSLAYPSGRGSSVGFRLARP